MNIRYQLLFPLLFLAFSAFSQNGISIFIDGYDSSCFGCSGYITASATGGTSPYAYYWSTGGTTPTMTGLCGGVYTVTVTDAQGLTATATEYIFQEQFQQFYIISLNHLPCNSPDSSGQGGPISGVCEKVCSNSTVTYVAEGQQTSPVPWKVIGAQSYVTSPGGNSVTVTWGGAGTGTVSISGNGTGNPSSSDCFSSNTVCVNIIEEPKAQFSSSPAVSGGTVTVCKGQTVYFQNESQHAENYDWTFSDDQSTAVEANPQHKYNTPGTYEVQLIARSECLCADTTKMTVTVIDATAPTIDCAGTVCPGATVKYSVNGGCAPFTWNVSGGTVLSGGNTVSDTVTVQWADVAAGTIQFNAQPCSGVACPVAGVFRIPVVSDKAEIKGNAEVCPNNEEYYSIESYGGTNFQWKVVSGGQIVQGQGTERITVRWTGATNVNHWVTVLYDNCYLGCKGRDSIAVKILPPFALSGPVEACNKSTLTANFIARFTTNNLPVMCNWTLFAPNGTAIWTKSNASGTTLPAFNAGTGYYRILAVPNGPGLSCTERAEWYVNVLPLPAKPTSIKGEKRICPNTAYTYEALGLSATESARWTVKNGAGAVQIMTGNPLNVTWGANGPYWISAVAVGSNGLFCNSDTTLLVAQTITPPDISGIPILCEDEKAFYSIAPLPGLDIQWTLSPASSGAIADGQGAEGATIFWSQAGGHVVNVSVCGQSNQFPVTVLAKPDPVVQHPVGLCPGATGLVQTAASYASYRWLSSTGATLSTLPTPPLGAGTYSVQVTDGVGCKVASEFVIEEHPTPNVTISTLDPTGFCNNSLFVLMKSLTTNDGDYTYQWSRDGNPIAGATNSTYSTNQYGDYRCVVSNQFGCTAADGPITLFPYCGGGPCHNPSHAPKCQPGDVAFSIVQGARCDSFQFNLLAGPLYQPGSALWHFGESGSSYLGSSTATNPKYVFPEASQYIVVLYAQLTNGATCIVLDSVKVDAVADFTATPACPGAASEFEDVSAFLAKSGGISSWNWNFGNPPSGPLNTSTSKDPAHTYANTGNYTVKLTVTAASGCTSSITKVNSVPANPAPSFPTPGNRCSGNALEFSLGNSTNVTEIAWDFGDPGTGAANDAASTTAYHNYNTPGNYTVTATTKNVFGCTASSSKVISVEPNLLSGSITPANPGPICEGLSMILDAPFASYYKWSDDLGTTTKALTVSKEGTYHVTLTDPFGCTYVPPPVKVEVNPAPDGSIRSVIKNDLGQVVGYNYGTETKCYGEDVILLANAADVSAYFKWNVTNALSPVLEFSEDRGNLLNPGTYSYQVTVTSNSNGCTSVLPPFGVTINPTPAKPVVSANSACSNQPVTLSMTGAAQTGWQYIWNTGQTGTSITTTDPGNFSIRAINQFGCSNTSNLYNLRPGPKVAAIPGGCHTRCTPDTLCLPSISGITAWQWYYNGAAVPGATTSNFVATQSGTYHAVLTDAWGCTGTSDPLDLNLYTGFGTLAGQVWSDVNHNGLIDAADTLVSNIGVLLYQNALQQSTGLSNETGDFAFANILSTDYTVKIDVNSLPTGWATIIGQANATLSGCGDLEKAGLLIDFSCLGGVISTVGLKACPGGSANYLGTNIPVGTTQSFSFELPNGCDSVVNVTVSPYATSTGTLTLKACPGGSATYAGNAIATGATQTFALQNWLGCDSILTVSVQPYATSTGTLTLKACPGGSATYAGNAIATGASQTFALQNWLGCDSILTVSVSPFATSTGTLTLKACPGGSATYAGNAIATGATQTFVLQNWLGCDSILTVSVQPYATSTGTLTLKACPGGSATYAGNAIATGASQIFALQNWLGCDSILTVSVQPYATSTGTAALRACPGESVDYHGTSILAGTTVDVVLSNAWGCDSVVTVSVQSNPTKTGSLNTGICPGKTFTYNGTAMQAGETKTFALATWLGCDSVVTVTVKAYAAPVQDVAVSVCPGETYPFAGENLAAGTLKTFVFQTHEGCDSTITVSVSAYPDLAFGVTTTASCGNQPSGTLSVTGLQGGTAPLEFSLNGQSAQPTPLFEGLSEGDYALLIEDANGCQWTAERSVAAVQRLQIALSDGLLPCDSAGLRLEPRIDGAVGLEKYHWYNGDSSLTSTIYGAGPVWVEASNECETVRADAQVEWSELAADFSPVYMPNVFSPAAKDYENTMFKPHFAAGLTVLRYRLMVFDRWGNELYETTDLEDGWAGAFKGKNFQPGVVVWHLEADVAVCGRVIPLRQKGDVTVMR